MFRKKFRDYFNKNSQNSSENLNKEVDYTYEEITKEIELAKSQWEAAKNLFNNSTEPDQVDYSVYLLEVYEKKLEILYKKLRNINGEE